MEIVESSDDDVPTAVTHAATSMKKAVADKEASTGRTVGSVAAACVATEPKRGADVTKMPKDVSSNSSVVVPDDPMHKSKEDNGKDRQQRVKGSSLNYKDQSVANRKGAVVDGEKLSTATAISRKITSLVKDNLVESEVQTVAESIRPIEARVTYPCDEEVGQMQGTAPIDSGNEKQGSTPIL